MNSDTVYYQWKVQRKYILISEGSQIFTDVIGSMFLKDWENFNSNQETCCHLATVYGAVRCLGVFGLRGGDFEKKNKNGWLVREIGSHPEVKMFYEKFYEEKLNTCFSAEVEKPVVSPKIRPPDVEDQIILESKKEQSERSAEPEES
jgi:hypothetical protein